MNVIYMKYLCNTAQLHRRAYLACRHSLLPLGPLAPRPYKRTSQVPTARALHPGKPSLPTPRGLTPARVPGARAGAMDQWDQWDKRGQRIK